MGLGEAPRPFSQKEVEEMSCTTSALAGRLYGVKLVCRTWEQPRSPYYVARQAQGQPGRFFPAGKRGPKTPLSDAALLELVRVDLNTLPFQGEGHRKVWARLRVRDGVKVGRRRVLRLMRENHLLSPYRGRRGNPRLHEGEIITPAPNLMWGTDGARVFTVEEGWGWTFVAVEHWNAECVGWRLQTGDPVCGPGAHFPGAEGHGGYGGGGCRPRPILADGPRHPVPIGSFPEPAETLVH